MQVQRFEDLIAWQRARLQAPAIYDVTRTGAFSRDQGLGSQLQRAAVSVMANIAEGFERRRPAEVVRFLDIAGASNAEVLSHLYVALDVGYLDSGRHEHIAVPNRELARIIAGLRRSILPSVAGPALRENSAPYDPNDGDLPWELGTGNRRGATYDRRW